MTAPNTLRSRPVAPEEAGMRLDRFLADTLPDLSRSRIKSLLQEGHVTESGQTISDPSYRVKPQTEFEVSVPAPEEATPAAQDIPLTIVYEDADLLVIDKPAGLVVHPGPGQPDGTLVNALLAHCGDSLSGVGGVKRPGIVHRLDKDTSGLIVVAKNDAAHQSLSAQFADRSIDRSYRAIVWGVPMPPSGRIEGNIGRHPKDRKKMAVVAEPRGKSAATNYRLLQRFGDAASLVECKLESGRTHQIRVHMTHIGYPIIGDQVYGRRTPARKNAFAEDAAQLIGALNRQALHAAVIGFEHPRTAERLKFSSELPRDMKRIVSVLSRDQTTS
jgi:23S rRNA pseudouridine1911/1915/1917 synthase